LIECSHKSNVKQCRDLRVIIQPFYGRKDVQLLIVLFCDLVADPDIDSVCTASNNPVQLSRQVNIPVGQMLFLQNELCPGKLKIYSLKYGFEIKRSKLSKL